MATRRGVRLLIGLGERNQKVECFLPAGIWSPIGEAAAPDDVTGAAVVLRPGKRKRVVTGLEESSPHPESHPASFPDSSHNEPQLLEIICHMTPSNCQKAALGTGETDQ